MSIPAQLVEDLVAIKQWAQRAPTVEAAEVDTALLIIGDGVNVIATGIIGAWGFDFRARITGWWIQEFEGTAGSISITLAKAPRGPSPAFASIVGSAPPAISGARYAESSVLTGWTDQINRNDIIRVQVTSVATFKRILLGLRVRRLEP